MASAAEQPLTEEAYEAMLSSFLDGHAIRASDVKLGWTDANGFEHFLTAYEWNRRPQGVVTSMVECCFLTSKTGNHGGRPERKMLVKENSVPEGKLVIILSVIADYSDYGSENELFFSHRSLMKKAAHGERKTYRLQDVSEIAKVIATDQGWPTKGFSSKSFKVATITAVSAAGVSRKRTAAAFGHKSEIASGHYIGQLLSGQGGGLALIGTSSSSSFSSTDVKRNLQLHHGYVPKGTNQTITSSTQKGGH